MACRRTIVNDDPPLDVFALLDEVQAIARTGLHFSENPFDRERYTKLLDTAQRQYAAHTTLDRSAVQARFEAEIGYVTAKVGVDAAVFDERDRILLARRVDDDKWGLIAGWVDPNESPEQTAVRELAEEVGVQARVDRLVGVFFREARAGIHPHGTVSIVYLCTITAGRPRPQPHEIRELAWRAVDDVGVDEWHHHHELLARAALEAYWRSRAGV
jgi:ADP-ribose pyrophosphatase YjhB (NUDIX family)